MPPLTAPSPPGALVGPLWVTRRGGAGRPIVLLHGNGGSHREFDAVLRLLPGRDVVGIDSRAHGRSPRGAGPLTIASMADDVAQVLDLLGLDAVDVLGYSDGGNVALELARRHPGAAGRMLVCGANLSPDGLSAASLAATRAAHRAVDTLSRVVPPLHGLAERWDLMVAHPHIPSSSLAAVPIPVLVVAGEHDVIRPEHTRLIADALPAGRMVVVPGVGHSIPRRAPDALAMLAVGFFT